MNRLYALRIALIAGIIILGICEAGGQTLPLHVPTAAQTPPAPLGASHSVERDGLFTIDAVVTDAAGKPLSSLAPFDFTLLDSGQPTRVRTFQNSLALSESPQELIFVLDTINLSAQQLTQTETAILHFLSRNNGQLENPCFLYRLTRDGLFSSALPTRDGALLSKEVEQHKLPRAVWVTGRVSYPELLGLSQPGSQRSPLSLRALGGIAIDQRDIAGRKVVLWVSPGWPVGDGHFSFDEATEFSTRLREARITLDNIVVKGKTKMPALDYDKYIEPPLSQKDMQPEQMALQVLAAHTGGLVIDSSGNLDQDIERCIEQERSFYTLTFNPPNTDHVDEFHKLRVQVASPAVKVRAPNGYYNEPIYFDSPRLGIEKVTVAQLEDLVHSQTDLAHRLENLELTERLSTARLNAPLNAVHSERERQALTTDADLSIALPPPPDEIVNRPPPPIEEQRAMIGRIFDYLENTIPKLPDFYALRNSVQFEEPPVNDADSWKIQHVDRTFHFATSEHATVLYRNGKEEVDTKQKLGKHRVIRASRVRDLQTWGTFGPILAYVLTAAGTSSGAIGWKRWEHGKDADLAVFSFSAITSEHTPEITYCCLPQGDGTTLYENKADTFGDFALNPDSGAIMRIVINTDLDEERDPDVPLVRSQIMVEYGPEQLGSKTYISPQRSVGVSRGRSVRELHEWGKVFSIYSYLETMINDATFGGYHKFGSQARILPGFEETDDTKTPTPPANPH